MIAKSVLMRAPKGCAPGHVPLLATPLT